MNPDIYNHAAVEAGKSIENQELFLRKYESIILKLTSRITHSAVTKSDEEWSIALRAASSALSSYDESRGDFWSYAAIVIRSRINDWYRSAAKTNVEISVRPEVLDGNVSEEEPDFQIQMEVREKAAVSEETALREEITALQEELSSFGISFFDLAEYSPKSVKTRSSCASLIASLFVPPPPLTPSMRRKKTLPLREMLSRTNISKKIADRYRKYLITSALILDGDYPELADYLSYARQIIQERRQKG